MTQIVTVSAATAAYATEGLKPSARVSGAAPTPDSTHLQVQEARKADRDRHLRMSEVVGPAGIAVFFMAAGERSRNLPQTTLGHAQDAYRYEDDTEAPVSEDSRQHRRRKDDPQEDDEEEASPSPASELLALPAPGDFV